MSAIPGIVRDHKLTILFSAEEIAGLRKLAEAKGLRMSDYVRQHVRDMMNNEREAKDGTDRA